VILASSGEQMGVMKIQDALRKAAELGLDLVEVAPNAEPPVCRIVDFGKFKYEQAKQEKDKKHNAAARMKEIKFRVNIDQHDYETKEAAFEAAVAAASLAIRQGHEVHLSIPGRDAGNKTALGAEDSQSAP